MPHLSERAATLVKTCSGHREAFKAQLELASKALERGNASVVAMIAGDDGRWAGLRCEDLANVAQDETYSGAIEARDAWREEWQQRLEAATTACSKP